MDSETSEVDRRDDDNSAPLSHLSSVDRPVLTVVNDAADVLGDIGLLDPLFRLVRDRLQPPTSIRGMLTDLFAYGRRFPRRSSEGVKYDTGRDAGQAAHDEPLPYVLHVIALFLCQLFELWRAKALPGVTIGTSGPYHRLSRPGRCQIL